MGMSTVVNPDDNRSTPPRVSAAAIAPRSVIATAGSYGDLFPYIGIARGLAARGHEPVLATSPVYRPIVEGAGMVILPVSGEFPFTNAYSSRVIGSARETFVSA